jgi:hypothetical protein
METEPTGMSELDFITGDPPPNGQTIIIGAPGTGKKVMALQMAMHRARQEKDASIGSAQSSIRNEVPTIRAFTCLLSPMAGFESSVRMRRNQEFWQVSSENNPLIYPEWPAPAYLSVLHQGAVRTA